jgi:Protein of unknown function/Domain of unknown function (DUF1835)
MIHIVFQEADGAALQKSFPLDETLQGDIIQIKDDFAVGPIGYTFSEGESEVRKQWWREVLAGGDYDGRVDSGKIDDNKTLSDLVERLNNDPEEIVWVWTAQNKHDISGYYWLISRLKDFQGRIFILYLHNLPFISEKGHIFYPGHIFEIPAKEFLKAKKLARQITLSEFEMDPDEWRKLCKENKGVRTLEGGKKLIQKEYDYYDDEIMKFITGDWQKVNKLFHALFSKSLNTTGDAYLLWRLKLMISAGKIDAQGVIRNMKDFEVKKT